MLSNQTSDFKANGALNYQDPTKLQYGQVVDVTKQAPGAFKVMPEGTKIQTLEGTRTVQQGEVVALDHAGNPYATTPANILKRNTGFSSDAMTNLSKVDPVAVELQKNPDGLLSKVPAQYRKEALSIIAKEKQKYAPQGFSDEYIDIRAKEQVLKEMGAKIIYRDNDYQGYDPVVGFMYKGKQYSLEPEYSRNGVGNGINKIFEQITSGTIDSKEVTSFSELGSGRYFWNESDGTYNFLD